MICTLKWLLILCLGFELQLWLRRRNLLLLDLTRRITACIGPRFNGSLPPRRIYRVRASLFPVIEHCPLPSSAPLPVDVSTILHAAYSQSVLLSGAPSPVPRV